MAKPLASEEKLIDKINGVGGIILGVSEDRSWIEVLYEGDLMHTKKIELPCDAVCDVFIEEIPHKTTLYQHPRTLIYLDGPCDLEIIREGNRIIVRGCQPDDAN